MPDVSIVVPVFNSESTLKAAIDSARMQSLQDLEILVVDDGSTDSSLDIALEAAEHDPRVQVIPLGRNSGKSHAMNQAIDRARGRWVAVLDADDTFHPHRLERLLSLGEQFGVQMVSDDQNHVDGATGDVVGSAFHGHRFTNPVDKSTFLQLANAPYKEFNLGILKTVTRTDFIRTHELRYNELARLGEDFYYIMEFFVRGGTLWVNHETLYNWTLPFSIASQSWTTTGSGAWRYDYRGALPAHTHAVERMQNLGQSDIVHMLLRRARWMRQMIHYAEAQKAVAEKRMLKAFGILALHPLACPMLLRAIVRRYRRRKRLYAGPRDTVHAPQSSR